MHKDNTNLFACCVCGMIQDEPPWGEDGDSPTFNICLCCGVEFGYQDCQVSSTKTYRKQWLANGAKWRFPKEKPENWSLEEQMKNIPEEFR